MMEPRLKLFGTRNRSQPTLETSVFEQDTPPGRGNELSSSTVPLRFYAEGVLRDSLTAHSRCISGIAVSCKSGLGKPRLVYTSCPRAYVAVRLVSQGART